MASLVSDVSRVSNGPEPAGGGSLRQRIDPTAATSATSTPTPAAAAAHRGMMSAPFAYNKGGGG